MVSSYSSPDQSLLNNSYHTLRSCAKLGQSGLTVVNVKEIHSVIAMVPHHPFHAESVPRYFVVEKPGLEVASLGGMEERVPDIE